MTKPDLAKVMAELGAKSRASKPVPVALAPPTKGRALPWADVLPPETDWERAYRRSQDLPKMQVDGKGLNLNQPYAYRGAVGQVQKLSELPKEEQSPDSLRVAQRKAALDTPYRGTPQERIALSHIRVKQATGKGKKLTHEEKRLLAKFDMAVFLARAGLNRRQG